MRQIIVLSLIAMILAAGCVSTTNQMQTAQVEISTASSSVLVNAEVADTPDAWGRGLMFRTSLDDNGGMIFMFSDEQPRTFWMKNTLIPLDMIFISTSNQIVDIKKNFEPCRADPCPAYTSRLPARYVLEVNGGFADRNGVEVGNRVNVSLKR